MSSDRRGLTPAEHERLAWLIEEASEVIQVVGKILRHGMDAVGDPGSKWDGHSVKHFLSVEIADLRGAWELMYLKADIRRYSPAAIPKSDNRDDRMVMLVSGCSGIIGAACRVLRYGYDHIDRDSGVMMSSREHLRHQVGVVWKHMNEMGAMDDFTWFPPKRSQHLHHQGEFE